MSATIETSPAPALRRFAVTVADRLQGLVFSLKTFAAAILALVISYWLELKDPQWAVINAYLVAQPLVGAIWAKGAYRILGTIAGATFAVICVALFAQAGPLFILSMAMWLAACAFGTTLTRNYASYGFALAGRAPCCGIDGHGDDHEGAEVDRTAGVTDDYGTACGTLNVSRAASVQMEPLAVSSERKCAHWRC